MSVQHPHLKIGEDGGNVSKETPSDLGTSERYSHGESETMHGDEHYIELFTPLVGGSTELDQIREAWAEDPGAFFAEAWCQAVGWKADTDS